MIKKESRNFMRQRRHRAIRKRISGTAERPRLNVFRSNKNIHAQLVDDVTRHTIASTSSIKLGLENGGNIEAAKKVGAEIAKLAKEHNISEVVFDRGGYAYAGRVQALADSAREAGLKF